MKTEKNYSSLTKDNSQFTHPLTPSPNRGWGKISAVDIKNRKVAFTLAEVLITLGIIGVVAALTMPSVINHFRVKDLEARFKKVSSRLEQALTMASLELGIDNFKHYNVYNVDSSVVTSELVRIQEFLDGYFKRLGATKYTSQQAYGRWGVIHPANIDGVLTGGHHTGTWGFNGENFGYIFPDGSTISAITTQVAGSSKYAILFHIDTNGPHKGPNRTAHDLFTYSNNYIPDNNWVGYCDPLKPHSRNTIMCYHNALGNIPPNPVFKTYWDSLFKSESFWENLKDSQ